LGGLVSCVTEFGPGTFEIKARLPHGKNLWPAFWMWSWDSWPPEIDIFEGYSHKNPNYFRINWNKLWAWRHIDTNVHYTKDGKNTMKGPKSHFMGFKDPTREFIKYKLDWSLNSLKFYYNNRLVRIIDDPLVMEQVNSTKMNVVINNHITKDMPYSEIPDSTFTIKYFKYEKA
jgi:beta-glucanase (GH16 family)